MLAINVKIEFKRKEKLFFFPKLFSSFPGMLQIKSDESADRQFPRLNWITLVKNGGLK